MRLKSRSRAKRLGNPQVYVDCGSESEVLLHLGAELVREFFGQAKLVIEEVPGAEIAAAPVCECGCPMRSLEEPSGVLPCGCVKPWMSCSWCS